MKFHTRAVISAAVLTMLAPSWAADFKVADFGATGDGKTDDAPAARKALAAAIEAGPGSRVVFEEKTYRFARQPGNAILALDGAESITLEGKGAEIIGTPWNAFLRISDCRDVTMRGFVLDCDPVSFTQGDVIQTEPAKGTFVLRIHEGYANPVELEEKQGMKSWQRVGFTLDAKVRRIKPGPVDFIESLAELDRSNGLLKVKLKSSKFSHIEAGDRFVFGLHHGGHSPLITVERSVDIRLENYTIHCGKFGMNHGFFDNQGGVHVKGAKIAFRPGTRNLVTSIKDGFHVKHNRIGPIIEDCELEGMMDDGINISVCPYWVKGDLGENRYLIAEVDYSPRAGDRLMAYTPVPGTVTRDLKVLKVEPQRQLKGGGAVWNIITLDRAIPGLALHTGGSLFPAGMDKLRFTGLYNLDACGEGYIVKNNRFLPQRRHAMLARGTGGVFEGNTVTGVGGSGVYLRNEVGSFYEGPFPADTTIRGNEFRNTGQAPIIVGARGTNAWARNITIENNTFDGWPDCAMRLSNLLGGLIRDNTIKPGRGDGTGVLPMIVKDSGELRIRDNMIDDIRPGLTAAIDLSQGVDAATLLMSENPIKLNPEFPRLMKIVPPLTIQPRGQEIRPLRSKENTGAFLQPSSVGSPGQKNKPVWSMHPVWKNGLKGSILFELPADLTGASGIRFATRSQTGLGDGVVLTVEWKPSGAPEEHYQICHKSTIRNKEWAASHAKINSRDGHVLLRFRFDCGPADSAAYDTVQITNLDVFAGDDRPPHGND